MASATTRALLGGLLGLLASVAPLAGQDVELLGRIHGTRPPQAYLDLKARDPGAYEFRRALFRRGLGLRDLPPVRAEGLALSDVFTPALAMEAAQAPARAPVTGTFRFPLLMGLFSDSPTPAETYSRERVQAEFWDGPQANPNASGTVPAYYAEISRGLVTLSGTTFDWKRTGLTRSQVTAGSSGLQPSLALTGEFIVQTIRALDDGTVDWGSFDNDGPDGVPNSGDDDGYVDVLVMVHPTPGGECQSDDRPNRIWSHRWTLSAAASYEGTRWSDPSLATQVRTAPGYTTRTPRPGGGLVRIDDYTIQPVTNCTGATLNEIGVFAHELGHAFGLPDLYATSGNHNGIGNWGLMGTGSWGCNGQSPALPCHMEAWSKAVLGWVEVETLQPGTDLGTLTLAPVEDSHRVYRIDSGDGSGEYFLLENRQSLGFDSRLYEPGLLVWHIDPATIAARWATNRVNADPTRMGVWLRQADGLDELARSGGGRGDREDPFPGLTGNRVFHAGSNPASRTHGGKAAGVTLLDIALAGQEVSLRALTRYQTLAVRSQTVDGTPGLVSIDGVSEPATAFSVSSAPFQKHLLAAAAGEPIEEGYRWGFRGWSDGAPRVREFTTQLSDTTLTASYGGREMRVAVSLSGPVAGISPGSVTFSPGDQQGWVAEGQATLVTAVPRTGFGFAQWTGALAGRPNPTTVTVAAPMTAGALFDLTFTTASNPSTVEVQGGIPHAVALQVQNANLPVGWSLTSGSLPSGMSMQPEGLIEGTASEGGSFPLALRVRDAIGLEGTVSLTLGVVDPQIPARVAAAPYLLTGEELSAGIQLFLDRTGNANGAYDLGDLRAFLLRNPDLPDAADLQSLIRLVVPLGRLEEGGREVARGEARREDVP